MRGALNKTLKLLSNNRQLFIGVTAGVLIAVTAGLYLNHKNSTDNSLLPNSRLSSKSSESTRQLGGVAEQSSGTTSNTSIPDGPKPNTSSGSTPQNFNLPNPNIVPPSQPTSTTYTFFDGTYTPQLYTNVGDNNISEWANYSAVFDASSYQKLHLTWYFPASSPSFTLQVSNDKSSWTTATQGANTGYKDISVTAPYYRVKINGISCLPGYCESPPQPAFSTTIKGYFSN